MPYAGNKRIEIEIIYDKIKDKLQKTKTIIEPFCGSCAMSYYISLKHPKQFKYIINDNNNFLIELLNIMKDENKYNKFKDEINETLLKIVDKESYIENTNKETLNGWFIGNKYYAIRPFLYRINGKMIPLKDYYPIFDFLRNEDVEILNTDGCDVYNTYKNEDKSLILLDPPYMMTDNRWYSIPSFKIYEILEDENIKQIKSTIIFIVNNNFIMRILFKKWFIFEYDTLYQTTKKKTSHLIITNKKII